jgi:hypothetical protein
MKLDPDVHIGYHLVFFGKTGVTTAPPLHLTPFFFSTLCSFLRIIMTISDQILTLKGPAVVAHGGNKA